MATQGATRILDFSLHFEITIIPSIQSINYCWQIQMLLQIHEAMCIVYVNLNNCTYK